jgi:hypothetical protein
MLATINTPKVQAPFGVSLLHLVLIFQGNNQNYMKYIYNPYTTGSSRLDPGFYGVVLFIYVGFF